MTNSICINICKTIHIFLFCHSESHEESEPVLALTLNCHSESHEESEPVLALTLNCHSESHEESEPVLDHKMQILHFVQNDTKSDYQWRVKFTNLSFCLPATALQAKEGMQ